MRHAIFESLHADNKNLFFDDGAINRTWSDAYFSFLNIQEDFKRKGISPTDLVVIDSNKNFETYVIIMSCYLLGVTFSPTNIDANFEEDFGSCGLSVKAFYSSDINKVKLYNAVNPIPSDIQAKNILPFHSVNHEENSLAYIMRSSGSTGKPKVIPISRANLQSYINNIERVTRFTQGSRFSQVADLTFDLSIHDIFLCIRFGGTLVPFQASLAGFASRFFQTLGINNIMCVPSFLNAICEAREVHLQVENVFLLGEALPKKTAANSLRLFPNAQCFNLYGPTEATVAASYYNFTNTPLEDCIVSIGIPFETMHFTLSNDNELLIAGDQVFEGYFSECEKPFVNLDNVKYYKTGDICQAVRGTYHFKSRIDFQIKYRGYRVELEGIEAIFSNLYDGDYCALGFDECAAGNFMKLAVFYTNKNITTEQLANSLPKHLASIQFIPTDNIIRNTSGKVDRKAMNKLLA